MKTLIGFLTSALLATSLASPCWAAPWQAAPADDSEAQHADPPPFRTGPWPQEILELAESLPIQDGGRIKPLSTYAGFTLLRLTGRRRLEIPTGVGEETVQLTPIEWLLDTMFYTYQAADYPVFLVQNSEVIDALGVGIEVSNRRDRYSFNDLLGPQNTGISRLFGLANEYMPIDPDERSVVQKQVMLLAGNVSFYYQVLSSVLGLSIVPPEGRPDEYEEWGTGYDLYDASMQGRLGSERLAQLRDNMLDLDTTEWTPAEFAESFASMHETCVSMATARGEYEKIGMELSYYKADWIWKSLYLFLGAFLVTTALWLRPRNLFFYRTGWVLVVAATAALITAIVYRCLIRDRPPISTLYETIVFVTAFGATVALVIEWINHQRIGLSAAAIIGVVGVFLSNKFEMLDKQDTMPSLVAVLDTNFWLATHVIAINIGYSAGMLAALLGSIYVLAKITGRKRDDPTFFRNLARMSYGVLCFSVIFALVGTILGGIWANDSWGRFWGWDPKENGALLIVISQVAILHGRLGGFLREFGLNIAIAFSGSVIAFSWFGVNLLGIGLHSYGFTDGIHSALWSYYGLQWAICGVGLLCLLREKNAASVGEG
jgi:ABC-type transport system involved in cytochrome c biogenesis permease subunit